MAQLALKRAATEERRITIQSGDLLVSVLPDQGAKIDFFGRQGGPNVLFDSSCATFGEDYGYADHLPSADLTGHGIERANPGLASLPWDVSVEGSDVLCEIRSPTSPCLLRRHLSAAADTLRLTYEIVSESDRPMDILWSATPLLRISPGSRIVLPRSVSTLTVGWSARDRLGRRGAKTTPPWRIGPAWAGTADQLYSDRLEEGFCAYLDRETGQALRMRFDPDRIPYLGLWLCQGGCTSSGLGLGQYTLALEPCLAPCESLLEAMARGLGVHLGARDTYTFSLDLTIDRTLG